MKTFKAKRTTIKREKTRKLTIGKAKQKTKSRFYERKYDQKENTKEGFTVKELENVICKAFEKI